MRSGRELVHAMLAQDLSAAECEALNRWVKSSPNSAAEFVHETYLARAARDWFLGQQQRFPISSIQGTEVAANKLQPVNSQSTSALPSHKMPRLSTSVLGAHVRQFLRVAACFSLCIVALVFVFTWLAGRMGRPLEHARIVKSVSAEWASGQTLGTDGVLIGEPYILLKGLVLLEMSNGVKVVIEGPAEFKATAEKEIQLSRGKLVAVCRTKQSYGFTVVVPSGHVRDLGTEFGVAIGETGNTEVHVFEGEVEIAGLANSRPINRHTVPTGQGRMLDRKSGNVVRVPWNRSKFHRIADFQIAAYYASSVAPERWHKLRSQLSGDPDLLLWCDMQPLEKDGEFVNLATLALSEVEFASSSKNSRLEHGRHSHNCSLAVHSPADQLQIEVPGAFGALTLAAWVRLEPEPRGEIRHRSLLMSRWNQVGHVHWQFKGDGFRLTYPVGAGDKHAIYHAMTQKPLDGEWHFVATTIDAQDSRVTSHYVDGELVATQPITEPVPLFQLGWCTVGGWNKRSEDPRVLNGQIDDLFLWSRALSQASIRTLYMNGR